MSYLLDTHVLFWWLTDDPLLPTRHRGIIGAADTNVFVSAATAWEIAIKWKIGKWPEASVLLPDLESKISAEGLQTLNVTFWQAERAGTFDLTHRDPFDRLLAAQALDLGLAILTVDRIFGSFGCRIA